MKMIALIACMLFVANQGFSQTRQRSQSRSAKSGQYVTESYADKHKATTYTSRRRN